MKWQPQAPTPTAYGVLPRHVRLDSVVKLGTAIALSYSIFGRACALDSQLYRRMHQESGFKRTHSLCWHGQHACRQEGEYEECEAHVWK